MSDILPTLGIKGRFELESPLNNLISNDEMLECVSIRTFGEIIRNGKDPKTNYYYPLTSLGTTAQIDALYDIHQNSNPYIVGLMSESGKYYFIPSFYLKTFPIPGGVAYESYALSVLLGALPKDLALDFVTNDVKDLVDSLLGIKSKVALVKVADTEYVSSIQHTLIENARVSNITVTGTKTKQLNDLQDAYNLLQTQYNNLAAYVQANL